MTEQVQDSMGTGQHELDREPEHEPQHAQQHTARTRESESQRTSMTESEHKTAQMQDSEGVRQCGHEKDRERARAR